MNTYEQKKNHSEGPHLCTQREECGSYYLSNSNIRVHFTPVRYVEAGFKIMSEPSSSKSDNTIVSEPEKQNPCS